MVTGGISFRIIDSGFVAKSRKIKTILDRPYRARQILRYKDYLEADILKLPNFHRYPNNHKLLNSITVSSTTPSSFTIRVNPVDENGYHYGDIIEYGRPAIAGRFMKFQGYYPNMARLYSAIRKTLKAASTSNSSSKYFNRKQGREIRGYLAVLENEIQTGTITASEALHTIMKFPMDDETTKKLGEKKSDIYTVVINPKTGVKAAYRGLGQPHVVSKLIAEMSKDVGKKLVARIRRVGTNKL